MADPLFALDDITFGFSPDAPLFEHLDLSLHPGQKLGLHGPNGCGKTTLFRLIAGLLRPAAGRVLFRGRELRAEKDFRALRRAVGTVLQHAEDQLFCPTVLEDVAFGPLNLGLEPEEAARRARRTLERLGLRGMEDRLTHRLSGGEKKLVSLATVLVMEPDALLLDEPTNGLDPDARLRLLDILRGLPTARVVISHDWDFLAACTDAWLTLEHGRLSHAAPGRLHSHPHVHPLGDRPHEHGI